MRIIFYFICLISVSSISTHRNKRYLIFPRSSLWQVNYGITTSLIIGRRTIVFNNGFQHNIDLPYNISNFYPRIIPTRSNEHFDFSREMFYRYMIGVMDSIGLNGEECLLKTICEISEIPMKIDHKENLLEKIAHFIFTPSLDWSGTDYETTVETETENGTTEEAEQENEIARSKTSDEQEEEENTEFREKLLKTEEIGKEKGCWGQFSLCKISIVDVFSAKYLEK